MALLDFFRIILPYSIQRNDDGSSYAFNKEYVPPGFERDLIDQMSKLKGTTVHRHTNGNIDKKFLYNDYQSPNDKISELLNSKELIPLEEGSPLALKPGRYLTGSNMLKH